MLPIKFSINKTVGPSHLDSKGQLSIRSLVDFIQDCSVFQLDSIPLLNKHFNDNNSGMFLSQRQISLKRLPKHGEKLTVKTWIYKCNQSYGFRNSNIYDENGDVCVASSAVGVFVDYNTGKLIRVPQSIIDTVPVFPAFEMDYLPRKISVPKDIPSVDKEPFYVWKFMIDANNHVNNARYISLAMEYLPEEFQFSNFRVEYLLAAKQGQLIYPKLMKIDDGYIVDLQNEQGKHFAVLEFKS